MTDKLDEMETNLNAEFDAWFAKVRALTLEAAEPDEFWAELWFDGFTPEEAIQENSFGDPVSSPSERGNE